MDTQEETVSLDLPERIVSRVEDRLRHVEFDTPEEYITYAMEEVLYRVEEESTDDRADIDEEEIKDRLQSLGYLNEK